MKDSSKHELISDFSLAMLLVMKIAVDELNYMILFQGDLSVNLKESEMRERALHAKGVLENTRDRIVDKILGEVKKGNE